MTSSMESLAIKLRGQGRDLVFLHGLGGSSESWNPQLEALGNGFRCLAVDLPGYGGSPPTDPMTFAAWADALAATFDGFAVRDPVVIGHSLGGMLAQEFVARYPAKVGKLVLSCTSPAFGKADGDFQKQFIAQRLRALVAGGTMKDVAEESVPALFGPSAPREAIVAATATMAVVPEPTYRAALDCLVSFDRRASLAAINVPVLLLSAEHDKAAPPVVMTRMAEKIPHARHVSFDGLGHLPNIEAPARFNREIAAFAAG